ncbi:MAG: phosphoribosylglycinamide formyltransferase, partial [Clostridia bacterium]|nr:phosphoribosylglycinamide formyltransferase [Clostridia bacterium]
MKIAILASGRGSNMQAIVRAQQSGTIKGKIICVLSDKPNAAALDFAREQGIHTEVLMAANYESRVAYDKALVARLKELGAELVVLAGFMRLLSAAFIDAFPERVINIHPALLPAFPGLHAQRQALEYG